MLSLLVIELISFIITNLKITDKSKRRYVQIVKHSRYFPRFIIFDNIKMANEDRLKYM